MVMEIAQLPVKAGQEAAFQAAFAKAAPLIRGSVGCRSLDLRRSVENPSKFMLLVEWDTVDNHVKDFTASPAAAEVGRLVGAFFDGEPSVEHSQSVLTA